MFFPKKQQRAIQTLSKQNWIRSKAGFMPTLPKAAPSLRVCLLLGPREGLAAWGVQAPSWRHYRFPLWSFFTGLFWPHHCSSDHSHSSWSFHRLWGIKKVTKVGQRLVRFICKPLEGFLTDWLAQSWIMAFCLNVTLTVMRNKNSKTLN